MLQLASGPGDGVTVINVFTVEPRDQARAGAILGAVNERIAREPGFLGAAAHASLDGTRVANVARWRSAPEIRTALGHPDLRPILAELAAITTPEWHLYDLIGTAVAKPRAAGD